MFLPSPSDLLVNLSDCRSLVEQLLAELPNMFDNSSQTQSALGAALQAAYKMAAPTGGRITLFQVTLPNVGPGSLAGRETLVGGGGAGGGAKADSMLLGPATDFYKKLALDCSGQQVMR
jgi:protein transport protein SEC24